MHADSSVGLISGVLAGSPCDDGERMNAAPAHERRERIIDEPVSLELGATNKEVGHDPHAKVPAFPCAGVTRVRGAVVHDVDVGGAEGLLQRCADALPAFFRHAATRVRRDSHKTCPMMKANVTAVRPNTLKLTHVSLLALNATARFAAPSAA